MVKTRCLWSTGARISSRSFSAKSAARFAWQDGQKFLVWQEKASRCSARQRGHRTRANPAWRRPQSRYCATTFGTTVLARRDWYCVS